MERDEAAGVRGMTSRLAGGGPPKGDGGERVSGQPVATGSRARAVIDFANGLTGDLPTEQQPPAFGAFLTGLRLGIALALADPAWAGAADVELAAGLAEDPDDQHRRAVWALAQIRHRATVYERRAGDTQVRRSTAKGRTPSAASPPPHPSSPANPN
ncbi:MAG TPA: hypothetical protein VG370_20430 [Chloroflexota bacterium]|jgi:hypothetical protein|nr:hypothetical protein [Chloroflexota bacterium]